MEFNQLLSSLKRKEYKPIYWLQGDEPYFIDAITDYAARHILEPHEQDFNQSILYGQDVSPANLVSAVKRFPMMAPYQVIIVKEAQNWKSIEDLEVIIKHPVPTTLLFVAYRNKKLDGRASLTKQLGKMGVVFTSEKMKDYQVAKWVANHCADHNITIDPRAAALLGQYLGADLSKLVNALETLVILSGEKKSITEDLVQKNIGIDKDFNVFELRDAIGARDAHKAMLIARHFARNEKEHHIVMTIGSLTSYFGQLIKYQAYHNSIDENKMASVLGVHPYFVKDYRRFAANFKPESLMDAMEIISEIDLKSKGVGASNAESGELTRELVARLLMV
jgi:DNA polymerase-3 subunit delta